MIGSTIDRGLPEKMTITTENKAAILIHGWRGIASCLIGAVSIIYTSLLGWIVMSGTQPPRSIMTALWVFSCVMLCANLIGIALGFSGARDRSSRKLYPLIGLALNLVILMTFVGLALV